ncbi:MAG TPA: hypothetical protein VK000_05085 [Luteimonas sp.]|nr:hypothetical protein [Luteimonas sp.]
MRRGALLAMPALLLGLALALVPAAAVATADAQESVADAQESGEAAQEQALPGTGDDWIDARLADMDRYAARYPEAFIDEIARYLEAPRQLLAAALDDGGMRPGDVYYACALARASGRSCRSLIDAWRNDPRDGWEGVATRLELDAREQLHPRIREDITASYRRWARPLDATAP